MKYNRVLLKLSGEALSGKDNILDAEFLKETGIQIKRMLDEGIQVAIVCGAGNIWRGGRQHGHNIDRVRADQMGMMGTVINSLAIQDAIIKAGGKCRVMSAVPMAQICEIYSQYGAIEHLENGLDTDVGEGGDTLSTGEKQLISFARAIVANPKIIVLDEATASVDTITEQKIQAAIDTIIKGRTSIVIAHRLSTVKNADVILVVKNGKIIEQGNHKELIKKKGHYFGLYTRQYEDEKTSSVFE